MAAYRGVISNSCCERQPQGSNPFQILGVHEGETPNLIPPPPHRACKIVCPGLDLSSTYALGVQHNAHVAGPPIARFATEQSCMRIAVGLVCNQGT